MFTKDIRKEHDKIMNRVRAKKDETKNVGIRAVEKRMSKYNFSDPELGLCIRPAHSAAELIREGQELNHCVGSYVDDVAAGRTSILFVRKIKEPDVPYYTLEWKNGKIQQNRGYENNRFIPKPPEMCEFEKRWTQHVKRVNRRKNDGKHDHDRTAATA